jgi:hypothetical protein
VARGQPHRDDAAGAEPEDVGVGDVQPFERGGDVVGRVLERERAAGPLGVAVALLFDADDLAGAGEEREQLAEVRVDGRPAAVTSSRGARPGRASPWSS